MALTQQERQQLVSELIANQSFGEDQKDNLLKLTDNQLVALSDADGLDELVTNAMVDDDDEDDDDEPTPRHHTTNSQMSLEDWMETAPPEVQNIVLNAQKTEAQHRGRLIEQITANGSCPLTADQLGRRSTEDLEAFATMAGVKGGQASRSGRFSFLGAQGAPVTTNSGGSKVEPLALPGADYMTPEK